MTAALVTNLRAPPCTTDSWSNISWLLTESLGRFGVGLFVNSLFISGTSPLMEALSLGDRRVALKFGISELDL